MGLVPAIALIFSKSGSQLDQSIYLSLFWVHLINFNNINKLKINTFYSHKEV